MTIIERIYREPAALISAFRAVLYCAVLFGLEITAEQTAAILLAVEAVLALLTRQVVTPSAEVVVQKKPDGTVLDRRIDDRGASDVATVAAVLVIICAVVWLITYVR